MSDLTVETIAMHLCCISEDEFHEWLSDFEQAAWDRGYDQGREDGWYEGYDAGCDR